MRTWRPMFDHAEWHDSDRCKKYCRYCKYEMAKFWRGNWSTYDPAPDIEPGTSEQTSPLLTRLPAEIRNQIYRLALARNHKHHDGRISVTHAGATRHCHCDDCDRTEDALLLTCRSIYTDAAGMPYSEAPLSFIGTDHMSRFFHCMSPRRQQGIYHLRVSLYNISELSSALTTVNKLPRLPRLDKLDIVIRAITISMYRDIKTELGGWRPHEYRDIDVSLEGIRERTKLAYEIQADIQQHVWRKIQAASDSSTAFDCR